MLCDAKCRFCRIFSTSLLPPSHSLAPQCFKVVKKVLLCNITNKPSQVHTVLYIRPNILIWNLIAIFHTLWPSSRPDANLTAYCSMNLHIFQHFFRVLSTNNFTTNDLKISLMSCRCFESSLCSLKLKFEWSSPLFTGLAKVLDTNPDFVFLPLKQGWAHHQQTFLPLQKA